MAIKRILFPTDFSTHSGNAFYYATNLAMALNAEIVLFHCYKLQVSPEISSEEILKEAEIEMKRNTSIGMAELMEYGSRINPDAKFTTVVRQGDFTNHIDDVVRNNSIDLIIMSTRTEGSLKAFIFKSYADKVIDKTTCPIFIIPEYYAFEPLKHILFPSEYFDSDIKNLEYLSTVAAPFDAIITVANIEEQETLSQRRSSSEFEEEVRKAVQYPHIRFICLQGKNELKCISEYADENDIDLIVMATRKRNKFEKLYDESLTKKMAYQTSIPLLAFHVEEVYLEQTV